MELESQAPLMTHCQETLAGGTTIRAFGWQRQSNIKCLELLDNSQKAYYLMLCIQRWLNLVLDLLTAGIAVIVVALAMELRGTSSSGSIGIALVNVLGFNQILTGLITSWTMLETALGAVARIKNFEADTASENLPDENQSPPSSWPEHGALSLSNIHAAYDPSTPDVLTDISLSFPAGSKIGICGRSGSGKSSLLLALLRLLDTSSGTITLDGVDIARLPRQLLRERITALPQEPFTLPGSIRANLDPLAKLSDTAIEAALEKIDLLAIIKAAGGLDTSMADLALSHGQTQLFAVARAILRPSKVVILDEMTSSVDNVTEAKMMDAVHEVFKDSTIIAVAHRLKTIVEYDVVVVIDAGRVVEVGKPGELLGKEGGWFRGLYERNGH
jgi:ATP-binding cassette subfamily C (CFTR/MRP) protein 1